MAQDMTDLVSKRDYDASQAEIADLRKRLEAANEAKVTEQVSALNKTIASRDEEIKTLKTEVENSKASKADTQKALDASKAEVDGLKTKLTEAETKIAEHAKTVVRANRISALVDKGVEKAEAEKIVDSSVAANDELFNVILDTHAKLVEANKKAAEAAAKVMPDDEKDKDKKKKTEKQAAQADEQKLDEAKKDEEVPLSSSASADTETDVVVAGLAEFLTQQRKIESKNKK